ncbi:MAG: hypothetical protein HON70_36275, partial [Lentisphaerae bacterium]|nr:hypothetical protein [Lentisphaerota bacterium]
YFRTRDRWHVIGLNGPLGPAFHQVTESREISGRKTAVAGLQFEEPPPVVTGQATVEADDRWHSVRIHLLQALEMLYPGEAGFVVTGLHLANWSNAGYRQCGFGGNRAGASCRLDNVMLGTPGGADVRLGWQGEACGPAVANWSIRGPSGSRGGSAGVASRAHIRAETSGTWLARVTPVRKRGNRKRERTVQHRFWVDADAPSVVRTEPGPGVAAAPSSLSLLLVDRGGSGVDSAHVSVRVAGTDIARDALRLDGNAEETHLRIALGGLTFADGESVSCEVHARDRAGNEMAMPHRWSWTFRTAEDVLPPSAPRLVQPNEGDWEEGFEQESWEWGRFPGSAWAEAAVDDSTAATGDHCLRVSGGPGPYRCFVRRRPFDVEARPVLTFQYLADPGSTWDIGLRTDRGWSVVSVNGGTRRWRQIGRMRRHRADGKWQQAVLPIGSWLKRARAYDVPVVEAVAIVAARGMRGGQPTTLRVDDMRLGPLVYAGGQLGLAWSCDDVGGVSGYGVTVDRFPATEPPEAITTATASLLWDVIPERQLFFHCRGRDRAGNWGAIRHTPLVIRGPREEEPPELVRMSPEDGARTAAEEVELRLRDRGSGVSVESVVLWVDKQRYALGSQQLAFQRDRGDLLMRWRGTRDDPAVPVFGKGDVVQCRLSVADYAGNRWPEPRSWSWEVDPAMDRDSPAPPHMVWRPADALVYNGFEEEQRHWIGRREGWAEVTPDHAATGRRAIRLGGFSTFMQHTSFDVSRHPVVAFQYCLPAGATMNLMIRIENRNWEIRFNSDRFKYPCIGRAEGVVADGTWRGCRLDIAKMLPNATVVPRGTVVDHLATLNRSGGSYLVDDFCIGPATPSAVRVQWAVPSDASGIRGYSLAVDTSPDTVPDVSVETVQPFTVVPVDGTDPVFVHCRAVDGAGNAGGAAHLRISP